MGGTVLRPGNSSLIGESADRRRNLLTLSLYSANLVMIAGICDEKRGKVPLQQVRPNFPLKQICCEFAWKPRYKRKPSGVSLLVPFIKQITNHHFHFAD